MGLLGKLFNKKKIDSPPTPRWKPNLSIEIDLIFQKAKYYTNNKLQFAIFKYGTVAFLANKVDNIEASAKD